MRQEFWGSSDKLGVLGKEVKAPVKRFHRFKKSYEGWL